MITPPNGGTGTVRVAVRSGVRWADESSTPVPVPSYLTDHRALVERLALPHLELTAVPGAVPIARHHARQLLWDCGLEELIEPVELVVSEIVTNAIQASGGMDTDKRITKQTLSTVRLWLSVEERSVLVLVWDASPSSPERQEPGPEAESGRGLLLVEMLSAAWGAFELAHQPGKVVWALVRAESSVSAVPGTVRARQCGAHRWRCRRTTQARQTQGTT